MSNLKTAKGILLAGVAGFAYASPALAQLDEAMRIAQRETASSAASQQRVETLDDDADSMAREYSALLQQVDNLELFVARQDLYLESQVSEIRSLERQLETIESTKQNMIPMMLKMAYKLEDEVNADFPFDIEKRKRSLNNAMLELADPAKTPDDQFEALLKTYKNEMIVGRELGSYEGPHPADPNKTVDFINFGRLSFVYMTKDESEIKYYDRSANNESERWKDVPGNMKLEMRNAIRMALGETGDSLALVPVKVSN